MHGSTNSGHPVCAAVGLAAIDIILREKLPENAAKMGLYLKSRLLKLMDSHPMIGGEHLFQTFSRSNLFSSRNLDKREMAAIEEIASVARRTEDADLLTPILAHPGLLGEVIGLVDIGDARGV